MEYVPFQMHYNYYEICVKNLFLLKDKSFLSDIENTWNIHMYCDSKYVKIKCVPK